MKAEIIALRWDMKTFNYVLFVKNNRGKTVKYDLTPKAEFRTVRSELTIEETVRKLNE